jgi:hypothetical protein
MTDAKNNGKILEECTIVNSKEKRDHSVVWACDKGTVFKDPKEAECYVIRTFSTLSYLGLTLWWRGVSNLITILKIIMSKTDVL